MRKQNIMFCLVSILLLSFSQGAFADEAIKTMANIIINLNHYPSDDEKKMLTGIVKDSKTSAAEKTVAQALINLQHNATDDDKAKLAKIISDNGSDGKIRDLAKIIHDINHKPSAEDKTILKAMM